MNLYQATELASLEKHVDFETGEVDIDSFNRSLITLKDKQQAVVAYLKNKSLNIETIDNVIISLLARKKTMHDQYDSLENYLLTNMLANDITEITANDFSFSAKIKLNPHKLVITDAGKIPCELYVYPVAPEPFPDNALIKAALKAGQVIEGAHLVQNKRLDIK